MVFSVSFSCPLFIICKIRTLDKIISKFFFKSKILWSTLKSSKDLNYKKETIMLAFINRRIHANSYTRNLASCQEVTMVVKVNIKLIKKKKAQQNFEQVELSYKLICNTIIFKFSMLLISCKTYMMTSLYLSYS